MRLGKGYTATIRHHTKRARLHTTRIVRKVHRFALNSPKKIAFSVVGFVTAALILVQVFYPGDMVVPLAAIDTVKVGGMKKSEAAHRLDEAYRTAKLPIYFTDEDTAKVEPTLSDIGVRTMNEARVQRLSYPWYWRLVPSSLWWYQGVMDVDVPEVAHDEAAVKVYMAKHFGTDCVVEPINATIEYKDGELKTVKAKNGGVCDAEEVRSKLLTLYPRVSPERIVVKGTTKYPEVTNDDAKAELDRVQGVLDGGVPLKVGSAVETIPADVVRPWVIYEVKDGTLVAGLKDDAANWLSEKYGAQFAVTPGVTTITTRDFVELSRVTGANGQAIDGAATRDALAGVLRGEGDASVVVRVVPPTLAYNRSYSPTDTGLAALMKNYAESHSGTYGASIVELSGARRHADYNGDKQFITASTYKLFVAYSALLRVERGEWHWSDQINGGRDLATCFDVMIRLSNNECAEAMLLKIGFREITNEARAIGATQTTFLNKDGIQSTARDQAVFLSALYSGQILSQQSSRDRLINAMKANVYRRGIPAGVGSAIVANKVGFMDGLLHDAGIVYSPTGAYVLVILTDGSNWGDIAELARQIEALRNG